ncbi:PLP-dependent aminotransferase family protein [Pseudomonas sp. N40(2020)]|uniref:aminotransferase-like domain-containing protein n=1 Tax=Pseudomonas sp. N40(2020) TaxID=2767798 RepID=UPI001656AD5A|nr:PLP-dependent aminotransferase family protein [Pseudomonas sp. N40(2020)]MBC8996298.1 PLP-dependent aminotransferase family protein [Pseudomonas sp. N40(2020)]
MELRIDRQAMVPVVQQIVDGLTDWILQSGVPPATRLPSVRQIARGNLLSQSCVVEACERLVSQGVLSTRQGAGFIVAASPSREGAEDELLSIEGRYAWCDAVCGATSGLKLGGGGLPESWREPDDLSYALREVARTDMASLFNYSTPLGLAALREQIVKRLKLFSIEARSTQLLSTCGASHALDLIVRTLFKAGDCVVVETPGYAPLFDLLRLHGVRMLEVRRTPSGPDLEALEVLLQQFQPGAFFINSHHHNPTGSCLTPAVAQRVMQLSKLYDVRLIEDDVYADLHTGNGARLAALDDDGRVIYVGSFSKTLSSSLRVGFVKADSKLIERLAQVKMISGLGGSRFSEAVLTSLLATGAYRKLVNRQRQRLNADRAAALQALEDADWEVFGKPTGGLFIWARSRMTDQAQVYQLAQRCGVLLSTPDAFSPNGEAGDWLRINVAYACDPRARQFFRNARSDRPQVF